MEELEGGKYWRAIDQHESKRGELEGDVSGSERILSSLSCNLGKEEERISLILISLLDRKKRRVRYWFHTRKYYYL